MKIRCIKVTQWSLPLVAPFSVAKRTAHVANNVLVQIHSDCGQCGCGSSSPVEYITGETQTGVIDSLTALSHSLDGQTVEHLEPLLDMAARLLKTQPAARAGLEMALYDLWAKRWQIPLWEYFGGAGSHLVTDITVPIVPADEATRIVKQALLDGFDAFKVKIGDSGGHDADFARIDAVVKGAPTCHIRIDANQAFTPEAAVSFVKTAQSITSNIQLVEQPVAREDFDGLKYVRGHIDLPLFADESARTYQEAKALIRHEAVDGINIKLMKSGIREAVDIVSLCRRNGIRLMVGCMLESSLGVAAASAIAAGTGSFNFIDLDSHVLLKPVESLAGKFKAIGPKITLDPEAPGWGVSFEEPVGGTIIDPVSSAV
jgi:L-Ala-D/L-Glu epimerase